MQIKGVLWYQGESAPDAENPNTFEDKFKLLVSSWRKNFNNPELPFYCVQLASIEQRKNWPKIRAIHISKKHYKGNWFHNCTYCNINVCKQLCAWSGRYNNHYHQNRGLLNGHDSFWNVLALQHITSAIGY